MVKFNSFYDWELTFKKKTSSKKFNRKQATPKKEPLGIKKKVLEEYLMLWKKKNLP